MDWLTQNWIYLLLLAGVVVFMRFGGMGCGMAGRRAHPEHKPGAQPVTHVAHGHVAALIEPRRSIGRLPR